MPSRLRDVMINERLGFEFPRSVCVKATKNGGWKGGDGQGYHNCYYIFTDGVQCALMTNSAYPKNPMDPETAGRQLTRPRSAVDKYSQRRFQDKSWEHRKGGAVTRGATTDYTGGFRL